MYLGGGFVLFVMPVPLVWGVEGRPKHSQQSQRRCPIRLCLGLRSENGSVYCVGMPQRLEGVIVFENTGGRLPPLALCVFPLLHACLHLTPLAPSFLQAPIVGGGEGQGFEPRHRTIPLSLSCLDGSDPRFRRPQTTARSNSQKTEEWHSWHQCDSGIQKPPHASCMQ